MPGATSAKPFQLIGGPPARGVQRPFGRLAIVILGGGTRATFFALPRLLILFAFGQFPAYGIQALSGTGIVFQVGQATLEFAQIDSFSKASRRRRTPVRASGQRFTQQQAPAPASAFGFIGEKLHNASASGARRQDTVQISRGHTSGALAAHGSTLSSGRFQIRIAINHFFEEQVGRNGDIHQFGIQRIHDGGVHSMRHGHGKVRSVDQIAMVAPL